MEKLQIREFSQNDQADLIELFQEFGLYSKSLDDKDLKLIIIPDDCGQRYYQKMITEVDKNKGKIYVLEANR